MYFTYSNTVETIPSMVVHVPQCTRLGDRLLAYAHMKYFSYIHNIKLLYRPFPYAEQFMLSINQEQYSENMKTLFNKIVLLDRPHQGQIECVDTLYEVPWFVPYAYEGWWAQAAFEVDWGDPDFIQQLRQDLMPRDPAVLTAVQLPADRITVAVHVRNGGGHDIITDDIWSQKFPPESYYSEQIQTLFEMFNNQPLYVHIFTDDQDPCALAKRLAEAADKPNIEFGYRKNGNMHDANVLEDFFGMARCDCIIMPASNFSYMASRIGNHRVIIMPAHHRWEDGKLIIDLVHLERR
jgi:hypothetical protein